MELSEHRLARRARREYELGRLWGQLWLTVPVLALAGVAAHFSRSPLRTLATAGVLWILLLGLRWWGRELGRGALPGLASGAVAMMLPLLACATGVCSRAPSPRLVAFCLVGGLVAGAILSIRAWCGCACGPACTLSAGLVAVVTATLTCAVAGLGGVAGMAVGLAMAGSPALVLARCPS